MEFGRGISIQDEKGIQGPWLPVTPAKPVPTRPRSTSIMADAQGNRVARSAWLDSMGFPADFFQGAPSTSNVAVAATAARVNSTGFVDQQSGFNNWEPAGRWQTSKPTINTYAQAMNNSNQMSMWNSVPFAELLALANVASPSVNQNNAPSRPYFPFHLPEPDNDQPHFNSSTMSMEQNYSMNTNFGIITNHQPQLPQHGFPVSYSSMHDLNSSPRIMYDLNSSPTPIVDTSFNGNMSFKSVSLTPDKDRRVRHYKLSGLVPNVNMPLQYTPGTTDTISRPQNKVSDFGSNVNMSLHCSSLAQDRGSSIQHDKHFDAVPTDNRSNQCSSLIPDQWSKMQQLLEAVSSGGTLSQFAPITPDKGSTMQQNQSSVLMNNLEEDRSGEKKKLQIDANVEASNYLELHSSQDSCLESVVNSSPPPLPTPSKENYHLEKGKENGIDLNKTPQQKPRRKKHRPRVVIEGKPKSTPKSTEKKSNQKGNERVKRKYVRKNAKTTSETPSGDVVEKINGENQSGAVKISDANRCTSARSCKRSLNFDLESQGLESQGETQRSQEEMPRCTRYNSSSTFTFNNSSESLLPNLCTSNENDSETPASQFPHGLEKVQQKSRSDYAFNLNCEATMERGAYTSLPAMTPQPTRRELLRENLKVLGRDGHDARTAGQCQNSSRKYQHGIIHSDMITENILQNLEDSMTFQSNILSLSKVQNQHLLENRHETASKRAHSQITDGTHSQSLNLVGANLNSLKVYHEMIQGGDRTRTMLFPEIFKKRRTEKSHNSSRFHVAAAGANQKSTGHSTKDGHMKLSEAISSQQCKSDSTGISNGAGGHTHDYCPPSQLSGHLPFMQGVSAGSISIREDRNTFDRLRSSELMLSIRQTEMTTRKRSKGHTRVRDFANLVSVSQCNNMRCPPPRETSTSHDRRAIEMVKGTHYPVQSSSVDNRAFVEINSYRRKRSSGKMVSFSAGNEIRLQDHKAAVNGYRNIPSKSRGTKVDVRQLNSPVEDLIWRLSRLSMSGESNSVSTDEQNALVPYKGDDRVVPYEGIFDPAKRRRPRPKVDLDAETERVWKLLMGKEAGEGVERTDEEKEKWWEEERRVLHGRADSFIARMHLIQGDRRFTRWNGSVLDSVIGVFLTQNVSDHLSSSAFMSLASRFPLKPKSDDYTLHKKVTQMYVEEPEGAVDSSNIEWHEKLPPESVRSQDSQSSVTLNIVDRTGYKEMDNSSDSCTGGIGCSSGISDKEFGILAEAPAMEAGVLKSGEECASFAETEDGRTEVESSGISSQNSIDSCMATVASKGSDAVLEADRSAFEDAISSENANNSFVYKNDEVVRSCSGSNSEGDGPTTRCTPSGLNGCTSFMELLRTTMSCNPGNGTFPIDLNTEYCYTQSEYIPQKMTKWVAATNAESDPFCSHLLSSSISNTGASIVPSANYAPLDSEIDAQCLEMFGVDGRLSLHGNKEKKDAENPGRTVTTDETTTQQSTSFSAEAPAAGIPHSACRNQAVGLINSLEQEACLDKQPNSWQSSEVEINRTCQHERNQAAEPETLAALAQGSCNKMLEGNSRSPNVSEETLDVVESTHTFDRKDSTENADAESIIKEQVYLSEAYRETTTKASKHNAKVAKEKKKTFDWDYLRKEAYQKCGKRERNPDTMDSLNWEAVRLADVNEIADAIKERGMNNMLADRIKEFLNRLVKEHEDIDLEWLRDVPPDKAKEYLLSVRGLGLKSVECVRLLTLHHLAFPVDTNVGRIAVRLGWVPLQPLPESLQLHLLELYPIMESIQKYLWPRLCTLDQRTLYELHYQLITFGKVFCTKSKPNCNACPMRAECRHFASAYASARLYLPGPEEKSIVNSTVPTTVNQNPAVHINPMSLPPPEANMLTVSGTEIISPPDAKILSDTRSRTEIISPPDANIVSDTRTRTNNNEPIIEVPASPEPECDEIPESDIEDAFCEDPDEIPTINLNIEDFAMNLQNYMQENKMEIHDGNMSKALVALNPEASIPTPKLKNVSRLRTEHQVYELPDGHPLLKGVEKRVPGEVSPYLLAIWTPGETAESIEPPEGCCNSQASGNLCSEQTCFSCNSVREANSQTVRGTLLIPCKTAMRGSFPLNGTYFQVNEVFADHDSSLNPIDVPRTWLWNLPRRTVYFGTSVPTIFKGQTTEQIQNCFWRGYVCVRGFDQKSRAPRPLMARLHFPASKLAAAARTRGRREE